MTDLMERTDPARGHHVDKDHLRGLVEQRIGITAPTPALSRARYAWVAAVGAFVVIVVVALPALLQSDQPGFDLNPAIGDPGEMPGVEVMTHLASGGVQTTAVDGETIWAMTALAHVLQEISASDGEIRATYEIDAHVEGVIPGGGYLWLLSYDEGGEVLRFDPAAGEVDLTIPIGGGWWGGADWFGDRLWVSNEEGELLQIDTTGEILATDPGELKGEGLGFHWVNDPATGLISSLADDGTRGEIVIPTDGIAAPVGSDVREVTEAGGYLWLMSSDAVIRFDRATGGTQTFPVTHGLLGMTGFDDSLWATSNTDHLLARIDPETGEATYYPVPGKAGGVFEADGSLWVSLYHPGSLIRLDADADLFERGELVADVVDGEHRLLCTGAGSPGRPTILLEPIEWIDYGSWSVVQARLAGEGYRSCTSGYTPADATPETKAADLAAALDVAGMEGPFVLAANGDGVHAARIFADGRDDVVGIVLVDPMPVGFPGFLSSQLGTDDGDATNDGHPPWTDLDPAVSDALGDFADLPLAVIGQDPQVTYQSPSFVQYAGEEVAAAINDYWQTGLDFYAGLSTDSRRVTAIGDADVYILWNDHDLVVEQILDVINRAGG